VWLVGFAVDVQGVFGLSVVLLQLQYFKQFNVSSEKVPREEKEIETKAPAKKSY
jgi:hypothetical protein